MAVKDFHIRPARHDDADFLLPLINRAGEGIPEYIWAELEGRPAGCLIAYQQPDVAPPLDPDLPSMFAPLQELENEARGRGMSMSSPPPPGCAGAASARDCWIPRNAIAARMA